MILNVKRRLNSVEAAVVLNDAYDDTYGLYGTTTVSSDPFAPVAPHKTEDVHSTSQYVYYLKRFRDYNVLKFYGYNFTQFMALPRYEAEQVLKECLAAKKSDNELVSQIEAQLSAGKSTL